MSDLTILVDENVPYGVEAFSTLGNVRTAPGRAINQEMLDDVNALVVRSITKVNEALVGNSLVRFVGTCTIGEDHIDKPYLASQGIAYSSAPGCNANSVGQYIMSALVNLSIKYDVPLEGASLGIVGVGNVGTWVHKKATAMGMRCVLNDPPLKDETGDEKYRPMEEILACDFVTLHVPIEKGGNYPTWHMADSEFMRWMKPGAFLLNASRGPVVDNRALLEVLESGHLRGAVLDVWEGEPVPNIDLLKAVDIATPHIAGYSFEGKYNGTTQIYRALCASLGVEATWDVTPLLPPPEVPEVVVDPGNPNALNDAVLAVYDIMRDDADMRAIVDTPAAEQGAFFDGLRKNYPRRREFFNTVAKLTEANAALQEQLEGIGFEVR